MRDIKFRVWDEEYKNMILWDEWDVYPWVADSFQNNQVNKSLIFEQYTGLKDKNGKEIYEGDIVRHERCVDGHDQDGSFDVYLKPSKAGLVLSTIGFISVIIGYYFIGAYVLGNIIAVLKLRESERYSLKYR